MKNKLEVTKILKNIRYELCILERDYGIEYCGYLTQVIRFITECIADKYRIDLELSQPEK